MTASIALIASATIVLFVRAWAASALWLWFISEPFHVFKLPISHAAGIMLLHSVALGRTPPKDDRSTEELLEAQFGWVLLSLLAYGVGRVCVEFLR